MSLMISSSSMLLEVAGLHLPPLLGLDDLLVLVAGAHRRGQGQRLQLQHLLVHHQINAKEDKTVLGELGD